MPRTPCVIAFSFVLTCSACSSSDTGSPAADAGGSSPTDGSTAVDAGTPVTNDASTDAATTTGALGTCTIEVDGAAYSYPPASGFGGATAVKRDPDLNVDCRVQSGPGVVQVVQLLTKDATAAGTHSFVASGSPTGLAAFSTTDVGGTVMTRYQQDAGWTLTLTTSTDTEVAGTASFTGKSTDGTTKAVVLKFHLKAER